MGVTAMIKTMLFSYFLCFPFILKFFRLFTGAAANLKQYRICCSTSYGYFIR